MATTPIRRFLRLLGQYNTELRRIYVYAFLNGIVNLTLPLGIQAIINYIQTGELTSSWVVLVCFVLLGMFATGVIQLLQLRVVENIQQDLFTRSAFEFAFRFPKITFLQLDKVHAPELVNRFFDTITIQKGLPKILIDFSLSAFQVIFGLVLLAIYSFYFIILGFALILIVWLIVQITGPKGLRTSLKASQYKYQLAHWLEEIARLNGSFKLNTSSDLHLTKTDEITFDYLSAREKHFQVLISQFKIFIGFKVFVAASLLLLGGILVFQEQMNLGQFVAAEIIIILIINSIEKILGTIENIYLVLTALEKIGYVTDLTLDKSHGLIELETTDALSVQGVDIHFGFPEEKKIFTDLSFEIPAGSKTVIAGTSGSGKTMLLQLIAGLHTIEEGELYINKIPFANCQRDKLYENIGMAFPSNQLFEATFRENITMGREISDKDITEIIEVMNLTDYFAHQTMGIDTSVDSGGRRLPRSIIQKLLIARILVVKPGLLLLEDPLQFMQDREKKRIIDYIMDEKQSWTVIVVADYAYWREKSTNIIILP